MTDTIKPPLPEPYDAITVLHDGGDLADVDVFTAGQLCAYADAAVALERERCAELCDDMVLYTGFDCAAAIRASKEPK